MTLNSWMCELPDNMLLTNAVIPGTHDSCARIVALKHVTKCQDLTIKEQLHAGVRYFDMRLALTKKGIKTVHSVIDCRKKRFRPEKLYFSDVFSEVREFLSENPSEPVILCVKHDNGRCAEELYKELYESFIKPYPDQWLLENKIPSIGECRGKLVVFRRDSLPEGFSPSPFGLDFTQSFDRDPQDGSESLITHIQSADKPFVSIVQDNYAVPPKRKWSESVLPCLEKRRSDESTVLINFLSCNNGIFSPKSGAKYVNSAFSGHVSEKGAYGIIVCDYITPELGEKIAGLNFLP